MNSFAKSLLSRRGELEEQLKLNTEKLSEIQSSMKQLQRELDMVAGLLDIHDINGDADSSNHNVFNSSEGSRNNGLNKGTEPERSLLVSLAEFESAIVDILSDIGEPIHVSRIEAELRKRKIPIPGRGQIANIITRMRRAQGVFTRIASGTYALSSWGHTPMSTKRRRKRSRRSKVSNA